MRFSMSALRRTAHGSDENAPIGQRRLMTALAFIEIRALRAIDHCRQMGQGALTPKKSMPMKNAACASILTTVCAFGLQGASAAPIEARTARSPTTSSQINAPDRAYSTGQVKSVDWDQGKVLIAHGPIENLGMPGMTMLFRVSERSLLRNLNNGDKIQFKAEKANGTLFVVEIVRQ
ncbi:copper-binding protein [Variovorax gossypii]